MAHILSLVILQMALKEALENQKSDNIIKGVRIK